MSELKVVRPPEHPVPLYERYDRQDRPQRAYLCLDEDGTAGFHVSGETGSAMPESVWSKRDLRWPVPPESKREALCALLAAARPLLERVHAGRTIEWDGRNHVGRYDEDAGLAEEEITGLIEECLERDIGAMAAVWDAEDWYAGAKTFEAAARDDAKLTADTTDEECEARAREAEAQALADGVFLDGDLARSFRRVRDGIRAERAEEEGEEAAAPAP